MQRCAPDRFYGSDKGESPVCQFPKSTIVCWPVSSSLLSRSAVWVTESSFLVMLIFKFSFTCACVRVLW